MKQFYGMNPVESFEERAAIFETAAEGYRRGRRGVWKTHILMLVLGFVSGAILMGCYIVTHPITSREIRCNNEVTELKNKVSSLTHERDGLMFMFAEKKGVERDIALRSLQ